MRSPPTSVNVVACSIFHREIELLQARGELSLPFHYLDSMLHMVPEKLCSLLNMQIDRMLGRNGHIVLLYGDCHPTMHEQAKQKGVCRVKGVNCCEIMLGSETYRSYLKKGTFFLMPEWVQRWETVFRKGLGLSETTAKSFMGTMHTHLLYLDTQVQPVPEAHLAEISRFTGLCWRCVSVSLIHLRDSVNRCVENMSRV
ncbi:MAG: DUF1638 domain-containing protein [Desulfobacteraceae bacterium]